MKRWILIAVVVLAVLGLWFLYRQRQRANTERLAQQCEQDGASVEQFEAKLPGGQAYRAPQYDVLAARYSSLKKGQTRSDVRGLLGSPSYVWPNVDREGLVYENCYWAYVVRRSIEGNREVDDVIHVFFDPSGYVRTHFRKDESWSKVDLEDRKRVEK